MERPIAASGCDPTPPPIARRGLRVRHLAIALALLAGACGSDEAGGSAEPIRSYTLRVEASDDIPGAYLYTPLDPVDIRVGDEVTFEMTNTGMLGHDLNVFGSEGDVAGVPAVEPGGTTQLTVLFEEAGPYQLRCYVDDHLTTHKMVAAFDVSAEAADS